MPHDPRDQRYQHLTLVREQINLERRKKSAPPTPPPHRDGRSQFANDLRGKLNEIEEDLQAKPAPPFGIQPHLVFRVPLASNVSPLQISEMLSQLDIAVVSIEPDNAIIAFKDDLDLRGFRNAVDIYERGPTINTKTQEPYKSTRYDILEYIESNEMRLLGRADRIGVRLASEIGATGENTAPHELYHVDVELWHRGSDDLARAAIEELRILVQSSRDPAEKVCDYFHGQLLCLARVAVMGLTLHQLLDLDIVAEVELPPVAVFDTQQAIQADRSEFPTPPLPSPDGPRVCVVDSGATSNHPLLVSNFGHAESVLTSTSTAADENGHGTMVAGLAVFGHIRACYSDGHFSSPITLFSARVLNARNRFDDETLIIKQVQNAIDIFVRDPYSCRVFNLSLGDDKAWLQQNTRQSLWAESLDIVAREKNVLLVLCTGNHNRDDARNSSEAEAVVVGYPDYLFAPECGLAEPATAAIPITVGGITESATPAVRLGRARDDITFGIAQPLQPSPFTRIGPGINDAIKPEFVAFAGNSAFRGMSGFRTVASDNGMSVMSLSHSPSERLFSFDVGTSFAAPLVARTAAIAWKEIETQLGREPQANLIRALLAGAAAIPEPIRQLLKTSRDEDEIRRVCGYGLIDEELAIQSADRYVTMLYEGNIQLDTIEVFEVPIPAEFREASGRKRITVALAFNPPVRRRRAEYLGVRMNYALIRGKRLDEIIVAYRQLTQQERDVMKSGGARPQGAFQSPFKCDLQPTSTVLQCSTLQKSTWQFNKSHDKYGESYYLVVRAERRWAPASFTSQDYSVAVSLQADEPQLYNLVRNRVQVRQRAKMRR
ncbi:MAG: S8 family peptidase [Pirellulales bacterium]